MCTFKLMFNIPCPGCGMTRSLSSILHFELVKAWSYHPFGIIVIGIMLLFVFNLVAPTRVAGAMRNLFDWHYEFFEGCFVAFGVAFVSFGLVRIIAYVLSHFHY